jgi:prepilin-type N-terminal cleavage/methylation domain-containing protein
MILPRQSLLESRKQSSRAGFTIIETLIVLAIAGLILLIVFEAIPALERSSRNNQRKQDIQTVLEAVSHYELSNSGDLPQTVAELCANTTQLSYYTCSTTDLSLTEYSYDSGVPGETAPPASRGPITGDSAISTIELYNYQKCDANADGKSSNVGAGYNDVVALFALESGGGTNSFCENI